MHCSVLQSAGTYWETWELHSQQHTHTVERTGTPSHRSPWHRCHQGSYRSCVGRHCRLQRLELRLVWSSVHCSARWLVPVSSCSTQLDLGHQHSPQHTVSLHKTSHCCLGRNTIQHHTPETEWGSDSAVFQHRSCLHKLGKESVATLHTTARRCCHSQSTALQDAAQ